MIRDLRKDTEDSARVSPETDEQRGMVVGWQMGMWQRIHEPLPPWFWFIGIAMLSIVPVYCKDLLHAAESVVTLFLVLFSFGIGAGSILCEQFSFKRTELGLVPIGSLGLSLFAFDLFWVGHPAGFSSIGLMSIKDFLSTGPGKRISLDIFFLAVSGGFFTVPLYTFIQ